MLIHCYTKPEDIEDPDNLAALGSFCRRLGREARQGEVGLLVGNEYFAIQEFEEDWPMKKRLNRGKIAKGLGATRRGEVTSTGGYFGAQDLLAEIEARFRTPPGGGRATDPTWTERRLVPLAPHTLERLEHLAARVRERSGVTVQPMQLAALLLERSAEELSETEASELLGG